MSDTLLYRLCYCSTATKQFNTLQVGSIMDSSCRNNVAFSVTGVLFFGNPYFLQFLEGQRKDINVLYRKICADDRHSDIQLLELKPIESRYFEEWSMKYIYFPQVLHKILQESGLNEFNPYLLDDTAIEQIAVAFRNYYEPETIPSIIRAIQRYIIRHGSGNMKVFERFRNHI